MDDQTLRRALLHLVWFYLGCATMAVICILLKAIVVPNKPAALVVLGVGIAIASLATGLVVENKLVR